MSDPIYFSMPQLLYAIPVLLAAGLIYTLKKARNKTLAISRMAVFCLIMAAAANPYVIATHIVKSEQPTITFLDDKTASMQIFDPDVAARLNQIFPTSQTRTFSGESTPLGDKIIQYGGAGSTLVLVSDGYSNKGRPLSDALALSRASNTTVFAIEMDPLRSDASVEIAGTNTAVVGEDYSFTIKVRAAGEYQGDLTVYADDKQFYTQSLIINNTESIKISHTFQDTGTHILRASISPDFQPVNDNYQKAVFVVPKPAVALVSQASDSPLSTVLSGLYKVDQLKSVPSNFQGYKAVIVDDQTYRNDLDSLTGYVRDGGGLVVVGGPDSYELGGYLNSTLEGVLPVKSSPSTFQGGKTVVMVLDISLSMLVTKSRDGTTLLDYEKALAVELTKSPDYKDAKVGVVVFGTKAYDVSDPIPLSRGQSILQDRIASLSPSGAEVTDLDNGVQMAWDMMNRTGQKGDLIILSDGVLNNYQEVFQHSIQLLKEMNTTTTLIQVQAIPDGQGIFRDLAVQTGSQFQAFTYPESLTTKQLLPAPEKKPEDKTQVKGYAVSVVNKDHYITMDLDLNTTITGFNDVTPKPGSQKLVSMTDGKPVLTTWRYGLGRVAALSTDDGNLWASYLYSANSSQLISSTVNWAIGDPRPETNRIDAEDDWAGTPLQITIQSNSRPSIDQATIEKIGENRYLATLTPDKVGVYYIGDYGIAINYPLEYRDVGFNPDLPKLIMANGGKVFTEAEAKSSLIEDASLLSQKTVQDRVSRRDWLLLSALAIFLLEVVGRKLIELRRRGQ